jgi:hypothetical protein
LTCADSPRNADRPCCLEADRESADNHGNLSVTTLAVLLFEAPLAVAVARLDRSQQIAQLQADATRVASPVPDDALSSSGHAPTSVRDAPVPVQIFFVGMQPLASGSGIGQGVSSGAPTGSWRRGDAALLLRPNLSTFSGLAAHAETAGSTLTSTGPIVKKRYCRFSRN